MYVSLRAYATRSAQVIVRGVVHFSAFCAALALSSVMRILTKQTQTKQHDACYVGEKRNFALDVRHSSFEERQKSVVRCVKGWSSDYLQETSVSLRVCMHGGVTLSRAC